jgi:hypothetical protein
MKELKKTYTDIKTQIGKINIVKMFSLSKEFYTISKIPNKIPIKFFSQKFF